MIVIPTALDNTTAGVGNRAVSNAWYWATGVPMQLNRLRLIGQIRVHCSLSIPAQLLKNRLSACLSRAPSILYKFR